MHENRYIRAARDIVNLLNTARAAGLDEKEAFSAVFSELHRRTDTPIKEGAENEAFKALWNGCMNYIRRRGNRYEVIAS